MVILFTSTFLFLLKRILNQSHHSSRKHFFSLWFLLLSNTQEHKIGPVMSRGYLTYQYISGLYKLVYMIMSSKGQCWQALSWKCILLLGTVWDAFQDHSKFTDRCTWTAYDQLLTYFWSSSYYFSIPIYLYMERSSSDISKRTQYRHNLYSGNVGEHWTCHVPGG